MSASADLRYGRKGKVNGRIVGVEVPVGRPGAGEPESDEQGAPIVEGQRPGAGEPKSDEQGVPIVEGQRPGGRRRSAEIPRSSRFSTRQSKICLPLNNRNSLFVTLRLLCPGRPTETSHNLQVFLLTFRVAGQIHRSGHAPRIAESRARPPNVSNRKRGRDATAAAREITGVFLAC